MAANTTDNPPPIPDVPYMIGIAGGLGPLHAIDHDSAVKAVEWAGPDTTTVYVPAECGETVLIARYWGGFERGNRHLHSVCPYCAWAVATVTLTTDVELDAVTPSKLELPALARLLPEPNVTRRLCEAILREHLVQRENGSDTLPLMVQLLAHATEHRPILLLPVGCAERDCDHETEAECHDEATTVACATCSVLAGSWAGEWEGQIEVAVPAPCSAFTALVQRYGAEVPR